MSTESRVFHRDLPPVVSNIAEYGWDDFFLESEADAEWAKGAEPTSYFVCSMSADYYVVYEYFGIDPADLWVRWAKGEDLDDAEDLVIG